MKNILLLCLVCTSAIAADQGVHITYKMDMNQGTKENLHGLAQYYFQDGNMWAEMDFSQSPMGTMVFVEKDGKKFTLFPQEKSYMEVTEFASNAKKTSTKQKYQPTGQKKKIAGYDCEVFAREDQHSKDSICVNKSLQDQYRALFSKMKDVNKEDLQGVEGLPLEYQSVAKGKNVTTTSMVVQNIENQNYAKKISIPSDYKKKDMPMMPKDIEKMMKSDASSPDSSDSSQDMQKKIDEMKKMAEEMKKKYGK